MAATEHEDMGVVERSIADKAKKSTLLVSRTFRILVIYSFYWIMFSVLLIYGIRIWHDVQIHPGFVPVVYVSFAFVGAFIVVITLDTVIGEIKFKVPGVTIEGATGPIILWVVCFLAISSSFWALHSEKLYNENASHKPMSISDIMYGVSPNGIPGTQD